jgi:hypothetical protein
VAKIEAARHSFVVRTTGSLAKQPLGSMGGGYLATQLGFQLFGGEIALPAGAGRPIVDLGSGDPCEA